ncbi:MAG: hypothetical protein IKK82_08325, partial [Kiritimatiellae bacterium]|nr:hypothetical protein [Kiritimatiellia bacterium]
RSGATMLANGSDTPFVWDYLAGSDLKSSLVYPNGLTASWTYDVNNQLLQVSNATPTNIISQYDYTYDAAGRRVACGKSGSALAQTDTISYAYNNRSELTNAVAAVDAEYRYAYDFDDIGNREASYERGTNSVYTANSLNQYTVVDDFIPQFDDDGNQTLVKTATGIWSVTYNGENRPILWTLVNSSTSNSSTSTLLSMSYDRMGRRVTKNGQRFVYDGYLQIVNFEQSVTNSQLTTHNLQLFIWDPTEPVATRPLVWGHHDGATSLNFEPSNLNFYTHDGNKNVSEIVAEDGDIAAHYVYAPLGAVNAQTGTHATANLLRFSSEYADDVLGLVYYNYRHYEPVMGRWICRDPVEEIVGGNTWTFCKNYSLNAYDVIGFWGDDGHGRGNMDTGLSGTPCPMPDFINEDRFLEREAKFWQIWKIKWPITSPFVVPWLHFRDISDSERLMSGAVAECDIAKYESYGHQLQDYYSHYGQNYRWYYLGHVPDSLIVWLLNSLGLRYFAMPDDTKDFAEDFAKAKLRMADWNGRWKECCCCSENRTWIKRQGRNEIRCKGGLDDAPPPVSGPNKPQLPNILPRFPVRVPDVRLPNNVHTEWFPTPGVIFQMSF